MSDSKLVKSAGEHWVCSAMSRRGWGVALTRDGLERTDILAVDPETEPRLLIEVQVKTARGESDVTNWPLGLKAQLPSKSEHEWFVLVLLGAIERAPRSFVVPRDHVAAAAWITHENWRTEPGIAVGQRNADVSHARVNAWIFAGYEDRWDLLEYATSRAPVLLPAEYRQLALDPRVGLPPDHVWRTDLPSW